MSKSRTIYANAFGTEPVVKNVDGLGLTKLLNWYYSTAKFEERAKWLVEYAQLHLHFDDRQLRLLASNTRDIPDTVSSLARAVMHGSTFKDMDRIKHLLLDGCLTAIRNAAANESQSNTYTALAKQRARFAEDRARADAYWNLQHQVDDALVHGGHKPINASCLATAGLSAVSIMAIKSSFLRELTEFNEAVVDREGYEGLHLRPAIKAVKECIAAIDEYKGAVKTVRRTSKIRVVRPDKVVSKLRYAKEAEGMRSVPPVNILSAKTLYVYDTKTRALIRCRAAGEHLTVKGASVIGNCEARTLRKPEAVLKVVRSSTEQKIERTWNALTTKANAHSGRLNSRCLLLRAIGT